LGVENKNNPIMEYKATNSQGDVVEVKEITKLDFLNPEK